MEEETIYTYLLIKEETGRYLGWSKAKEEKEAGKDMVWIEWNKPLPDDINEKEYTLEELEK